MDKITEFVESMKFIELGFVEDYYKEFPDASYEEMMAAWHKCEDEEYAKFEKENNIKIDRGEKSGGERVSAMRKLAKKLPAYFEACAGCVDEEGLSRFLFNGKKLPQTCFCYECFSKMELLAIRKSISENTLLKTQKQRMSIEEMAHKSNEYIDCMKCARGKTLALDLCDGYLPCQTCLSCAAKHDIDLYAIKPFLNGTVQKAEKKIGFTQPITAKKQDNVIILPFPIIKKKQS